MSKSVSTINWLEEIKSSIWLVLVVSLVLAYLIYGEQKKRRIPSDFDTVEAKIEKTQNKIKKLIEGENLPDLVTSLKEIQILAQSFGVNLKLDSHKKFRKERSRRKIGDLEYARSHHWSGKVSGNKTDILVFTRMAQQLVPIEFNTLSVHSDSANAKFTIVGS